MELWGSTSRCGREAACVWKRKEKTSPRRIRPCPPLWINERQIDSEEWTALPGDPWGGLESQFCAPAICADGWRTLGSELPLHVHLGKIGRCSTTPVRSPPTHLPPQKDLFPFKSGSQRLLGSRAAVPLGVSAEPAPAGSPTPTREQGDLASPLLLEARTGLPPSDLCISWITGL